MIPSASCLDQTVIGIADALDRTMVRIPGGAFRAGISASERRRWAEKDGVHEDHLRFHTPEGRLFVPDFWIDAHPVSRAQFLRFLVATGYQMVIDGWHAGWSAHVDVARLDDPARLAHPMVGVNAADAEAYARWAGKRLATEVEWEKAARGTDGRLFPWGDGWRPVIDAQEGVLPLDASMPVGARPELASPYGVHDMKGGVLEWTRRVFAPGSPDGSAHDDSPFVLAGSSILHRRPSSHLVTSRWAWHPSMRIYDTGFRCVSDAAPPAAPAPPYAPPACRPPCAVRVREDLHGTASVRLIPTDHASFRIEVPWFPGGCWVVDIPESGWGGFAGANDWPSKDPSRWRTDWRSDDDGRRLSYHRSEGGRSLSVVVTADGDSVSCAISPRGIGRIDLSSICVKVLNPFFCSQEVVAQHCIMCDQTVPIARLPRRRDSATMFAWHGHRPPSPGASFMRALDGSGYFAVIGPSGHGGGGNGCYPCTHLHGQSADSDVVVKMVFSLGDPMALAGR